MKRITSTLVALIVASTSLVAASQSAQAASSAHMYCVGRVNNDLLHPTYTAQCYNTKRQFRAGAWCQTYRSWGPWATVGGSSKATCFLLFVDSKKSVIELKR